MTPTRRAAVLIGALFLLTEVGAIVGRLLYAPVLNTPGYVLGTGRDASVAVGVLFETVLAWEISLALWLLVRGFNPTAVNRMDAERMLPAHDGADRAEVAR